MQVPEKWEYDPETGLYFLGGLGMGITLSELETLEDGVEEHEVRKRARIAEANEY